MNPLSKEDTALLKCYEEAWAELRRATADKKHPFRYFVLATVFDGQAYQRTVALRRIDALQQLWAYTDFRTPKIKHLQDNPRVSLLFFHPKKWLQIRIEATAQIHYQDEDSTKIWKNISTQAQKDYTTSLAPGSVLLSSDKINYLDDGENFFCCMAFLPQRLEVLQIRREGHLRAAFQLQSTQNWEGTWLVP